MKRNSKAYRLQLIKETCKKRERSMSSNPMVRHIQELMTAKPVIDKEMSLQNRFVGHHYDQRAHGWVDDKWS